MKLTDLPGPDWEGFEVPVDELHTDGDNPNEMSDELFTELVDNIRKYGWLDPILADADGLISDGEHRLKAAKEIGLEEVPVLGEDLDEADRRMLRLKMNKIHGEHDPQGDALEYDWLVDNGRRNEVLDLLDARDESLEEYLDMIRVSPTRENPPTPPPQPEVHNEDCVTGMADRVDDDEVDLIVTDPPYGVDIDISDSMGRVKDVQHLGTVEADHDLEEALDLWDQAMDELDRVASPRAHLYCFASWKTAGAFRDVIEANGWKVQNYLVWVKKDASQIAAFGTGSKPKWGYKHEFILFAVRDGSRPLEGYPDDVLEYTEARWADVEDQETIHPTQKPVSLIEELIDRSSDRGDLVIDPFAGSGATGEAACKLGRETRLWELEEAYIPVIERRVHQAKRQDGSPTNRTEDADDEEVPADGE